jgi:kynurenine formamidase
LRLSLDSYFATCSAGDLKGYKSHFHENARILFIEKGKSIKDLDLTSFIGEQALLQARISLPMYKKMTAFTIDADKQGVSATVQWELQKGSITEIDTHRFILFRDPKGHRNIICSFSTII